VNLQCLPSETILIGFMILFSYMSMKYFNSIDPFYSPLFLLVSISSQCSHFILLSFIFKTFLGLDSTYEKEFAIFIFLSLAYFT
jgi:hypothetical protein